MLVAFALFLAWKTVRIIPQARAGVVERLGRYSRTLTPGLAIVVPFVDRVRPLIDLREQVVSFPPQPVITQDNVSVQIDTVLYFTITDPKSASYEIASPLQAIEQLTVTTLRNIVGSITLEEALTSREQVNQELRVVLDERTGKWGIRVNGVELKSIDPPSGIQEAMEKQMRAERDRRAAILNAEGVKQSLILTAEGEKQSAVLRAEGAKTAAILRSEGEAQAINTVFAAIHEGDPDQALLSYQYLQMLPQLAQGEANKVFVIPSEWTSAIGNLGGVVAAARRKARAGQGAAGGRAGSRRVALGRGRGGRDLADRPVQQARAQQRLAGALHQAADEPGAAHQPELARRSRCPAASDAPRSARRSRRDLPR